MKDGKIRYTKIDTIQTTLDGGIFHKSRLWEPYKKIPIRLSGTNKTTEHDHQGKKLGRRVVTKGNCLDPVRGCNGGKTNDGHGCRWGCYAKEFSLRFHRIFNTPVSMILDEVRLARDLSALDDNWVRIGVNGDPCFDWNLTSRVSKIVHNNGKMPVITTRFWDVPDKKIITELVKYKVHLHGTLCAFDSIRMQDKITSILDRFSTEGGICRKRLVSFAVGSQRDLWKIQNKLAVMGSVIEQPARVLTTNPIWRYLDASCYKPHKSYVTGKYDKRRLCRAIVS